MMAIQIPDDVARGLEALAVVQRKSVEQVAVESLRRAFDHASSPEALLRAVRGLPHPSAAAVEDLEAAIRFGAFANERSGTIRGAAARMIYPGHQRHRRFDEVGATN
jgi:hypothetical protein